MKPRLLDLFCGAGGAAVGYYRAGFEVVGVDINPQPHYPFEFHQADALTYPLEGFDAIHASPPCQLYSDATWNDTKAEAPDLIGPMRALLLDADLPWVMENVRGAVGTLNSSLLLCGSMFDLPVTRHRVFESPLLLWAPHHECRLVRKTQLRFPIPGAWDHRRGGAGIDRAYSVTGHSRGAGCIPFWRDLMDMQWAMTARELTEAIPPAYTEWIGRQLLAAMERVA